MAVEAFWKAFLSENNLDEQTKYACSFHFDLTEYWANELLRLVLIGQKRATTSSLWGFEASGEPIPKKGDYNIVTDWDGNPKCVIKTTRVISMTFKDMTYDICKLEGEDDSLESWQEGHRHFFQEEGKEYGYTFTEEMPIIFEEFEVVYKAKE